MEVKLFGVAETFRHEPTAPKRHSEPQDHLPDAVEEDGANTNEERQCLHQVAARMQHRQRKSGTVYALGSEEGGIVEATAFRPAQRERPALYLRHKGCHTVQHSKQQQAFAKGNVG